MLREVREAVMKLGIQGCSVTNLRISKDWKYCDIYCVSTISDDDEVAAMSLDGRSRAIGQIIKHRCGGHFFPSLRFHIDQEARRIERVERILKELPDA